MPPPTPSPAANVTDGQTSFEGGQDSSLPASRLSDNKYSRAVNVTTKEGRLSPRYAWERKGLTFPEGGYAYQAVKIFDFRLIFEQGKFQALAPYQIGNRHYLVIVISGIIYLLNINTFDVTVLTVGSDTQLSQSAKRLHWEEAGRFLVIHDFPSRPVIIEGQTARRATEDELPASTMGAYNSSRLLFANAGNEFTSGDPVGNDLTPDAPITTLEITLEGSPYFAEIYQAPFKYDSPITAMATLQISDSSTGIGPLLVASKKEIWVFNTNGPRDGWIKRDGGTDQSGFGKSLIDNAGIVGSRSFTNVQSDFFFVSQDGQLRSITVAHDEQKKWSSVPMNIEVNNWVSYVDPELINYSTLTYFKNKIFWSVRPYRTFARTLDNKRTIDIAHSGFVVLETDNTSRLGSDSKPAWAGLWTGLKPMDACVTNERMFVMSKDGGRNVLYEVNPDLQVDRTEVGERRRIKSYIYTREHYFQDMFALKDLKNVEVGISNISGNFELGIDYKPSHSENFHYLASFKHEVPVAYKDIVNGNLAQRTPLAFRELKFGFPETMEGNPVTNDLYETAKRVQLRISISGDSWELNEYRIVAGVKPENSTEFLNPDNLPVATELEEGFSDWTYDEFGLGIPE